MFSPFLADGDETNRLLNGPADGIAPYVLPNRLGVVTGEDGVDFSLIKFILVTDVSSQKETTKGRESQVEMGGFMAFSLSPVRSHNQKVHSTSLDAPLIWRSLEIRTPSGGQTPVIVADSGTNGFHWNLNVLLERSRFEGTWQSAQRWLSENPESRIQTDRILPTLVATVVARHYRDLPESEAGDYHLLRDDFLPFFRRACGQNQTNFLLRTESEVQSLMRELVGRGYVGGLDPAAIETASPELLSALFAQARENWLEYTLDVDPSNGHTDLAVKEREGSAQLLPRIELRTGAKVAVETGFRMPVDDPSGFPKCAFSSPMGVPRESEMGLQFWPWGNWDETPVSKVRIAYEVRIGADGRTLDFGNLTVPVGSEKTAISIKTLETADTEIRCRVIGYYWLNERREEKFSPSSNSSWISEWASQKWHFFFLYPEHLGLGQDQLNRWKEEHTTRLRERMTDQEKNP